MQKINIKKNNLYWLAIPALCICLQLCGFFLRTNDNPKARQAGANYASSLTPQVLGASIGEIRGAQQIGPEHVYGKIREPDFSAISAKSFLAYDLSGGQILAEKNGSQKLPIASLTKLITALVAYDNLDLNSYVAVTVHDVLDVSPSLGLSPGDQAKVLDLLNAMLVGSANDAAWALANHIAQATGKNFVSLMNEKAVQLQMDDSNFSNPLGFDSINNYSTAQDLKKAVDQTQQLAVFTQLGRKESYSFRGMSGKLYDVVATNKLVSEYPDIEAVKTGHTIAAQDSMISKVTAKDGRKIIVIVLGSVNREKDTLKLKDEIFKAYGLE